MNGGMSGTVKVSGIPLGSQGRDGTWAILVSFLQMTRLSLEN